MTKPYHTDRRTVLKTMGIGVAAGGVFATTTAAGDDGFARQLNTVRSATLKYRDVATARAEGYIEPPFSPFPPVGHVFLNTDNIGNLATPTRRRCCSTRRTRARERPTIPT